MKVTSLMTVEVGGWVVETDARAWGVVWSALALARVRRRPGNKMVRLTVDGRGRWIIVVLTAVGPWRENVDNDADVLKSNERSKCCFQSGIDDLAVRERESGDVSKGSAVQLHR